MTAYRFIRAEKANHSVRMMCQVLEVSRAAYQAWRAGNSHQPRPGNVALQVHIRALHRRHYGRYGAPRITAELRAQGQRVNRKRVARLMQEAGLEGRPRRRFRGSTTDSGHELPIAPNLLKRNFSAERPGMALVGDITYLATGEGWVYLAVLIDLFSRKVVGWAMDDSMHTALCLRALRRARAARGDLSGAIHHSDRGSQYASGAYQQALAELAMRPSMSRKGNCWDNAVAESFFGTLEQELVPTRPWRHLAEARKAVSTYIHSYYNAQRRHSTLGYLSPIEFENNHKLAA